MTTLQIVLGQDVFPEWQVPCAALGRLRRELTTGILGEELPFTSELVCWAEGGDAPLQDSARLPSAPDRLRVEGPGALLRLLERALRRKLGPPLRDVEAAGPQAKRERLLIEAVGPWEEVCRAVGGSTAGMFFPSSTLGQFDERRTRRVLWLAGRPMPKKRSAAPQARGASAFGLPGQHLHEQTDSEDSGPERLGDDQPAFSPGDEVDGWKVISKLGHGHVGEVFLVSRSSPALRSLDQKAALKWTLEPQELSTWKAIEREIPGFPGLPPLLDSGWKKHERYAVTRLLGRDLRWLLPHFQNRSRAQRWRAVRVLGRMLLRRLQAIHQCGYVHADVSPYNVLFGCTEYDETKGADKQEGPVLVPYLIDYGLARPHPGQPLGAEHGTVEFISVRCAAGGPRLPEDDLEALGWVMAFLVVGDLPWISWEQEAEEEMKSRPLLTPNMELQMRVALAKRVSEAKVEVLCGRKLALPSELDAYLQACSWAESKPADPPDYPLLAGLLGGRQGLDAESGELEDIRECRAHLVSLL